MDDELAIISVLADSPRRVAILRYIDSEPTRVSTISNELSIPRRTVKHNLSRLEEESLVKSTGSEYVATTFGSYVCTKFSE